jgi:hypothetical protein
MFCSVLYVRFFTSLKLFYKKEMQYMVNLKIKDVVLFIIAIINFHLKVWHENSKHILFLVNMKNISLRNE